MSVAAFDTYIAAKRLRDAGFDEHHAEALVSMVRDATAAYREQLATKADFAALGDRFDAAIVALRADLAAFRADLTAAFASLERRLLGYGIALAGSLFAALKLF